MSKPIRVSGIIPESIVDGPGIRFVLFVQGCPHHCPGCHNPDTHDFAGGYDMQWEDILEQIKREPVFGVTFSGGEPFAQADALLPLAEEIKRLGKHLMVYSGYTFEQLTAKGDKSTDRLLRLADVLVDGRFMLEQKSLTLRFRGSSNQRVIDLPETFRQGQVVISRYAVREA